MSHSIYSKFLGLKNFEFLRTHNNSNNAYHRLLSMLLTATTQAWQRGELTNFEYLLYINAAAGRSFHDLTQYPVFPWIIADYTSEILDLENPETFRDLTKPMGTQSMKRAQQYLDRYRTMSEFYYEEEVEGSSPPFFYGTHYSCAGYVLHYLVRLEPYTTMSLTLQGGHFDKADRLFYSIENAWLSASQDNLQDVRELIPEFYYLPDFLQNINHLNLGITQRDEMIHHVQLPPWAHSDPKEFIRVHRMALECKYISEHLHSWIDLIFGIKQLGQAAIDSMNVFIHITYEHEVDIDAIEDELVKNATIAQINNFGQTPSKIFHKEHVRKYVPDVIKKIQDMILTEPNALVFHSHLAPPLTVIGTPNHQVLLTRLSYQQVRKFVSIYYNILYYIYIIIYPNSSSSFYPYLLKDVTGNLWYHYYYNYC
jgi:hypothetical protein